MLASAFALALGSACGSSGDGEAVNAGALAAKDANLVIAPAGKAVPPSPLDCPSAGTCFDVTTAGANITHIFIDVDAPCAPDPGDFDVTVDGQPVTKLHTGGGPCGDLDRTVWFPLQGNQSSAQVCVTFHGFVPSSVSVGAKAKNQCTESSLSAACQPCGGDDGSGGSDGAGGSGAGGGGAGGSPTLPPP